MGAEAWDGAEHLERTRRSRQPLVVAAHGSADPRFAPVVESLAAQVRSARPDVEVNLGYLDHGPPRLSDVITDGGVVVPLLLARGYHALIDIPQQAPGALVTPALGPDPRLANALADRLHQAGYEGGAPVVLAAAGSSGHRALADVRAAAHQLAERLGVEVIPAYLPGGAPQLRDLRPAAVASYLLAAGQFFDLVKRCGARCVAAPIGAHPAVTEIVLDRFDAATATQVPGRTAPA